MNNQRFARLPLEDRLAIRDYLRGIHHEDPETLLPKAKAWKEEKLKAQKAILQAKLDRKG